MKKIMGLLVIMILLSGCSVASAKAACTLAGGNNTVTITEGRDLTSDKDGQIVYLKQTFQIDSEEPDVIVIYKEYYEKELSELARDEKMKTSLTETETGLLITIEFDVKNINEVSKDRLIEILDSQTLSYEHVLSKMKESGFVCGDEEAETSEENTEEKKEAE